MQVLNWGVFQSTNDGVNWTDNNIGFESAPVVYSLLIDNDQIFSGTYGRSVWRKSLAKSLKLSLLIQGFYNTLSHKMVKDTVTVYLKNAVSPYSNLDSSVAVLDSGGYGNFSYFNSFDGIRSILSLSTRNSLETWSSAVYDFNSDPLCYDFISAASQAYGGNQIMADSST
ncbi:MAG: hypothetical protein IPL53_15905 [Ignavibacteria bacterium]|nr:hypothetical protein [Ignavibacteria bacterium]